MAGRMFQGFTPQKTYVNLPVVKRPAGPWATLQPGQVVCHACDVAPPGPERPQGLAQRGFMPLVSS